MNLFSQISYEKLFSISYVIERKILTRKWKLFLLKLSVEFLISTPIW